MVLGVRTKTRRSPWAQVDYIIHIQEINPWPPSQSLRTLGAVLIQWEHPNNKTCGLTNQVVPSLGTGSGVADGRIEFNQSFRLPLKLVRGDADTFEKNCIVFNLYEPRRDKGTKGQLLGSAVVDLAEYGIVKENLSVSAAVSCKRSYRNSAQPLLLLKIQPVEQRSESVSALMSEEYAEEAEVSSFPTNDDVSSHSSTANESIASADHQTDQNLLDSAGPEDPIDARRATSSLRVFIDNETKGEHVKHVEERRTMEQEGQKNEDCYFSHVDIQKQVIMKNGLLSSNTDRSNNGKSVRPSVDSCRSTGSTRIDHFIGADTVRGLTNSERKDAKVHTNGTRRLLSDGRIQNLERRIKILEGELMEAAAMEFSLYSVVAEHGGSMSKVHAPARRLSRLYFHANQRNSKSAKSVVSGLVLAAKACGNDVPRLTFWLSNSIMLRVIVNCSFGDSVDIGKVSNRNGKKKSSPLKLESFPSKSKRGVLESSLNDWENPLMFAAALERVEAWIFSRIIESLWWQTFTPHMQSGAAKAIRRSMHLDSNKLYRRTSCSIDHQQGNFSVVLWKKAFGDACERICPVRAGGHDCGCLPVLSKLIMEQLIARLDVAMFNAILRESADEIPTDPIADPISDAEVLPIPSGKASFGAGAQLKNAIGSWSRWLTDLFGIDDDDDDDFLANNNNSKTAADDEQRSRETSSKSFQLLNALSDLMMLPKDMLLSQTIRKEVCLSFGPPLIRRILNSFVPDEFYPDPIPGVILESLNSEDPFDSEEDSMMSFPCGAAAVVYQAPSAALVGGHSKLTRSGSSVLKKSQTSDDELDDLNSPLKAINLDVFQSSSSSVKPSLISKESGCQNTVRYKILQEIWMNSEQRQY